MDETVHDTASQVTAEDGQVMLDGPDGVAVALTPEAAVETSERLFEGALKGKGQQVAARRRKRGAGE